MSNSDFFDVSEFLDFEDETNSNGDEPVYVFGEFAFSKSDIITGFLKDELLPLLKEYCKPRSISKQERKSLFDLVNENSQLEERVSAIEDKLLDNVEVYFNYVEKRDSKQRIDFFKDYLNDDGEVVEETLDEKVERLEVDDVYEEIAALEHERAELNFKREELLESVLEQIWDNGSKSYKELFNLLDNKINGINAVQGLTTIKTTKEEQMKFEKNLKGFERYAKGMIEPFAFEDRYAEGRNAEVKNVELSEGELQKISDSVDKKYAGKSFVELFGKDLNEKVATDSEEQYSDLESGNEIEILGSTSVTEPTVEEVELTPESEGFAVGAIDAVEETEEFKLPLEHTVTSEVLAFEEDVRTDLISYPEFGSVMKAGFARGDTPVFDRLLRSYSLLAEELELLELIE